MPIAILTILSESLGIIGCRSLESSEKIDRYALVNRHNILVEEIDPSNSLSLGNGDFAFTTDITGLQTFYADYSGGVPLGTQSNWGWHVNPNPDNYEITESVKLYRVNGRDVPYLHQYTGDSRQARVSEYFRANPHRIHLGFIRLILLKEDGAYAIINDIKNPKHKLDLWQGKITSEYMFDNDPVRVEVFCHQEMDLVSARITSPLVSKGRLFIQWEFSYGVPVNTHPGYDFSVPDKHSSVISESDQVHAVVKRMLDSTQYETVITWNGSACFAETDAHVFQLRPAAENRSFEFSCLFTPKSNYSDLPDFEQTRKNNIRAWKELSWPEITTEARPWTRWWWMGSAVNKPDLTAAMEEYKKAGLGGLEITPIYGVKGYEDKFIPYLSPAWIEMLQYTLDEADRLGLGVDMATGTGWPFGGHRVTPEFACKNMVYKSYTLQAGETLDEPVSLMQEPMVRTIGRRVDISELSDPISSTKDLQSIAPEQIRFQKPLPLQVLMAYSDEGYTLDLTKRVGNDGRLNWTAPAGTWTLYALFQGWHGKMVERAAPGGEGDVIDHFSEKALTHYLDQFDKAFIGKNVRSLRAFFNDSYEVDDARGQADWTADLPAEFQKRRGYSLYDHLPVLLSGDSSEQNIRVLCDYRTTISELLLEKFTIPWRKWAEKNDAIIRNQSHGSPANILDLYAASDIPETEGTDIQGIKLASSAAHVTGKKLTSSESATWLNEHFLSTLADVKANIDNYFLGGVNHVFYHGTTYSPQHETWPGWMFYASVHFGPTNSLWNDFPALNEYVTRCQSFLQAGQPDNDILFYYPFYDLISVPAERGLLEHFSSDVTRFGEPPFYSLATSLLEKGYTFDYISDRQLMQVGFVDNMLKTGKSSYKAVVLPECKFIPLETFDKLFRLAQEGAVIIIQHSMPTDVPGSGDLEQRQMILKALKDRLDFKQADGGSFLIADIGEGAFLVGDDPIEMLTFAGIKREAMADPGLKFIRRTDEQGPLYFIVNRSHDAIDGWIPVRDEFQSAGLFNPSDGNHGKAAMRKGLEGQIEVFLQLKPGESRILKTYEKQIEGARYKYFTKAGDVVREINGKWKISFISGGPELPKKLTLKKLYPWTDLKGESVKNFSGTARYSVSFKKPEENPQTWILDLGRVAESARVRLNGEDIGTLIGPHYYVEIPVAKLKEKNLLEIDVSNLMANRIASLDRKSGDWKKFYNVNFPARLRENRGPDGLFNASKWETRESGLIGPVVLIPMKILEP